MSDLPTTSKGKIARLPAQLREAVNRRLHDMEPARTLLAWLNGTPECQDIMRAQFDGEPVSDQNLSNWRSGGFQLWLKEQKQVDRTRERAEYSRRIAAASGGNLAEGALAELTGEIMELSETITQLREGGADIDPDLVKALSSHLVAARAKELDTQALALKHKLADQSAQDLALREAKFQRDTAELFLKFYADTKAREIVESKSDKTVKMDGLVKLIFGAKPEPRAAA